MTNKAEIDTLTGTDTHLPDDFFELPEANEPYDENLIRMDNIEADLTILRADLPEHSMLEYQAHLLRGFPFVKANKEQEEALASEITHGGMTEAEAHVYRQASGKLNRRFAFLLTESMTEDELRNFIRFAELVKKFAAS